MADTAEAMVVLGDAYYTSLASAQQAQTPVVPSIISAHCALVGRIILVKSASTATAIESYFQTVFAQTAVTLHNDLASIQGGSAAEYYHLTSAEHDAIITSVPASGKTLVTNIYWDPDTSEIVVVHE